jgi:lysophospholipase L1-like esterase
MTPRPSGWLLFVAIGVTVAVGIGGLLTAQDRAPADSSQPQAPTPSVRYVALGDSFTAGGPIGIQQVGTGNCLRSRHNYPSLVAKELGYGLVDVSCIGATTEHVLRGSRSVPAAQVEAVDKRADLVTVSIGGNDMRVFADILLTCFRVSRPTAQDAPCRAAAGRELAQKVPTVQRRVGAVFDEIRRRAPQADILLVTYLRLVAPDDSCGAIPFASQDIRWFAGVEKSIADAMTAAAKERNIDVVDTFAQSRGHEVCSGREAWVNGPRPKKQDGLLYHPNAAGERAVAEAVVERLRDARLN